MAAQITHQRDELQDGTPYMRQIVTAKELRRLLRKDGESLERPKDFGPHDEWFVR